METKYSMPDGKALIVRDTSPDSCKLFIQSSRITEIGVLNKFTGDFKVFKKRSVHEHHNTRSYGFNSWVLHNSKHIKNIHIYEDNDGYNNEYLVPKDVIIRMGKEMNFIGELQIFFPINQLETFYKI